MSSCRADQPHLPPGWVPSKAAVATGAQKTEKEQTGLIGALRSVSHRDLTLLRWRSQVRPTEVGKLCWQML